MRLLASAAAMFAVAVLVAGLRGQDYAFEKSATPKATVTVPLTPEEKVLLANLDVRIAGVEALLPKIDEPDFKKSATSALADIKRRRAAIEKKFDPASYETLMHLVIGRYQVIALWLKPPRIPASAATL